MKHYQKKRVNPEWLVPPFMDWDYFEHGKDFPLDFKNKDTSLVNAWKMAEAAMLAYEHPGFSKLVFKLQGFENFKFLDITSLETYIASNKRCAIVGFRGTELKGANVISDVITDIRFKFIDFPYGGQVHRGFMESVEGLWPSLRAELKKLLAKNPRLQIFFTGHSLGGAGASLAASLAKHEGIRIHSLYTFGSPMVGNQDFATIAFNPHYRFTNYNDPIPQLPPRISGISNFPGNNYVHFGQPFYFDESEKLHKGIVGQESLKVVIEESKKNIRIFNKAYYKALKHKLTVNINKTKKKNEQDQILPAYNNGSFIKKTKIGTHAAMYYSVHTWNTLIGT